MKRGGGRSGVGHRGGVGREEGLVQNIEGMLHLLLR